MFTYLCLVGGVGDGRQGRPVYFDRPGFLQVDKIISSGVSPDDYVAKHVQDMEVRGGAFRRA